MTLASGGQFHLQNWWWGRWTVSSMIFEDLPHLAFGSSRASGCQICFPLANKRWTLSIMPKLIIWEFLSSQGTHPPLHYHNDQKPLPKDEHYREIQHIRPSPLFVPFLKLVHSMPVISLPFFKNLLIINNGGTIALPYTRRVFSRPSDNQHRGDAFPGYLGRRPLDREREK